MIDKKVKKALDKSGVDYEIREFPNDFKSSEDAAELIGIEMDHIAKTLVYQLPIGIAYKRAKVYMDESLRPYMDEFVYPSGGTLNSAIGIRAADLFKVCGCKEWIDISEVQ